MARRRCPKCAERVRREALICRYCGTELTANAEENVIAGNRLTKTLIVCSGLAFVIAGSTAVYVFRELRAPPEAHEIAATSTPVFERDTAVPQPGPDVPALTIGETIEWTAADNFIPMTRKAGPYVLQIDKEDKDDLSTAVLNISAGAQRLTVRGDPGGPSSPTHITLFNNRAGAVPVIMVQSFTGGAHCCNHVQVAGFSGGKLAVVDLGQWDGDQLPTPQDVSGDGVADFVMRDNRFLYAFAPYAQSYAPPQIFNVLNGRMVNVSGNPRFHGLFAKEMQNASAECQPGLGLAANGACASYLAAAARLGKLDQAWAQMVGAYDATVDWKLPIGCWVSDDNGCPAGQEIVYKSYPEALQAFLKKYGYISNRWIPPEQRKPSQSAVPQLAPSETT
jgi:hypothetical protein